MLIYDEMNSKKLFGLWIHWLYTTKYSIFYFNIGKCIAKINFFLVQHTVVLQPFDEL